MHRCSDFHVNGALQKFYDDDDDNTFAAWPVVTPTELCEHTAFPFSRLPIVIWEQGASPPLVAAPTHRCRAKIVQPYLPGGASVHPSSPNGISVESTVLWGKRS